MLTPHFRFAMVVIAAAAMALLFLPAAFAIDYKAKQAFMIDHTTRTALLEREADARMFPSSMSKLMTLYVLFDHLKQGGLKLDDVLPVSEKAWRMGGSKMFVHVGDQVKVEDLIHGIIVQSGNDACVVVAEALGGSEEGFAAMMNETAQKLGMTNSHFMNATGWPDENHYTTARDLATLAAHLVDDFPDYYPYFSHDTFTYSGITQPNRNPLLHKGIGVDGLKTGHTEIAGYGITLSAKNLNGQRLILVINGLESDKERGAEGEILLRHGFRDFEMLTLAPEGKVVSSLPVWLGELDSVELVTAASSPVTLPRTGREGLRYVVKAQAPVAAPIAKGAKLAVLEVQMGETVLAMVDLVAANEVAKAGFFKRVIFALKNL